MTRVRDLVPALETIVGRPLKLDQNVQDASYFTEVGYHRETRQLGGGRVLELSIGVRFSSFGDLFTVIGDDDADPVIVGRLIAAVSAAGFTYVPADELDEPYDGANPGIAGMTWWVRFFDYL